MRASCAAKTCSGAFALSNPLLICCCRAFSAIANKPDIGPAAGDKRSITFNEAGKFTITCDYHPAMFAWVWVE